MTKKFYKMVDGKLQESTSSRFISETKKKLDEKKSDALKLSGKSQKVVVNPSMDDEENRISGNTK